MGTTWPAEAQSIRYPSRADNTPQPAMFYAPKRGPKAPLLVALHTWSGSYQAASGAPYAEACVRNGWAMIYPDFRGPNRRPEACCSELVAQDILSAVDHCRGAAAIDEKRIYLAGHSGGGMAALYMAGRAPELWAGVSAWVPIFDLAAWHAESTQRKNRYADEAAACCGGAPGSSPAADRQYEWRSPRLWLGRARNVALDINAGITDGHTGSVPVHHALRAFNLLAAPEDRLGEEDIAHFVNWQAVPAPLRQAIADPVYGDKVPLFRRASGRARVTIFKGGHEIVYPAALAWLSAQAKT